MKKPFVLWTLLSLQFANDATAVEIIKWNKHVGEFEKIQGLPIYDAESKNRPEKRPQEETHNFNGQQLRLTHFQDPKFVEFIDNDTRVSGLYGDVWTILAEMLNFTLVVERVEADSVGVAHDNGSCTGIIEQARLNKTDIIPKMHRNEPLAMVIGFTDYFWENNYSIFARGRWQFDRTWMFKLFTVEVWCAVMSFVVILSLGRFAMQKILTIYRGSKFRTSLMDHTFDTLAALCNQGTTIDYKSTGVKILTLTIRTFSWLILTAYSAHLLYSISYVVIATPYKDLRSLYENTNLHVVVRNGSFAHVGFMAGEPGSKWDRIIKAKRLSVVFSDDEVRVKICPKSSKYVLLEGEDELMAMDKKICYVVPTSSKTISFPITSGISRRVKNKKTIDIGMQRLNEFGIIQRLRRHWFNVDYEYSTAKKIDHLSIGKNRLILVFGVLGIGVVASIVIFMGEIVYFALQKRKNDRLMSQQRQRNFSIERSLRNSGASKIDASGRLYIGELRNRSTPRAGMSWRPFIREHLANFRPAEGTRGGSRPTLPHHHQCPWYGPNRIRPAVPPILPRI